MTEGGGIRVFIQVTWYVFYGTRYIRGCGVAGGGLGVH